ncbi:sugar ABC transporter ATP-binding protein [Herbaspirillum sp. AP02]|uniref:sugar ABC transporter ATP-binding protein n=1 Tax=unclassified Herbaspirillum TaxID=2624150 RepID=UPI0015DA0E46|nr:MULTISPECIES: sugar ABC transporter ATP-binding protein [unclassified Herbaspirillum]MBG7619263.1 sugar ABC transporter ATP-binding protein [Herbaspirillum sp. AP02]NZD66547.1 sugar ABC transporter ATP-binding protein [Herbaspirillum sp. AP21]
MTSTPLLQMTGISKSFGATRALSAMHLTIYPGEIHALMGENGAGKSTLMKVLSGVHAPDSGEILLDGRPLSLRDPGASRAAGINLIYQELAVAPNISVAANVFMGSELRTRLGLIDHAAMRRRTDAVLAQLGAGFRAADRAGRLSIAEQQQVEIARALVHRSRIVIMDEPTAALSERETETLFKVVRRLRDEGLAIIYISHRMAEVHALADRVTVLRDGSFVGELTRQEIDAERIVQMMVGRSLSEFYQHRRMMPDQAAALPTVLQVRALAGGKVRPASFALRAGEVLGFAGLVGAGRTELARLLFGADARSGGQVLLDGRVLQIDSPRAAMRAGIAYVPEDRKGQGLFLQMAVAANATMNVASRHARLGLLNSRALDRVAQASIHRLNVKVAHPEVAVGKLSGGNQQKVLLARWLEIAPRVLILDEPTRGVDIYAKSEIYQLVHRLAEQGVAVVVISSELPEVIGICDRVLVMREGAITGELSGVDITQENIMRLATDTAGLPPASPHPPIPSLLSSHG